MEAMLVHQVYGTVLHTSQSGYIMEAMLVHRQAVLRLPQAKQKVTQYHTHPHQDHTHTTVWVWEGYMPRLPCTSLLGHNQI